MRGLGTLLGVVLATALVPSPAAAELAGPAIPPPQGCNPVALADVAPSAAELCVHRVLVTESTAAHEQNDTVFTVTDHVKTMTADVPNWWPSGGPQAGLVVTLWGKLGFGWYEIPPIRAWRYLTQAELPQQQADCAAAGPLPQLDQNGPVVAGQAVPLPFGMPPCTDGSEFGNAPGYSMCGPVCYVSHTAIDQPETLGGPCLGITPIVTRSQEPVA